MSQYSRVDISCTYFLQSTSAEFSSSNRPVTQDSPSGDHMKFSSNQRRRIHFTERCSPILSSSSSHAGRQHWHTVESRDGDDAEARHDAGALPPMARSRALGLLVHFLHVTKEANNMILSERIRTGTVITGKADTAAAGAAAIDTMGTPSNRAKCSTRR